MSFITRKFLNRGFTEEDKVLIKVLQPVQRDFFKNFQTEINANYFEPKSGNAWRRRILVLPKMPIWSKKRHCVRKMQR